MLAPTLAEALEERINQIVDPNTGETVGGVTVKYNSILTISHLQLERLAQTQQ